MSLMIMVQGGHFHELVSNINLKTSQDISGLSFLILFHVSFHFEKKILEIFWGL